MSGVTRVQPTLEQLVKQGRKLFDMNDARQAHRVFLAWDENVARWLDERAPGTGASAQWGSLPGSNLVTGHYYTDDEIGWMHFRSVVQKRLAWIAQYAATGSEKAAVAARPRRAPTSKVFVVHGHDEGVRETVARFLEQLHLEPVILHEQADKGRTIIEKFVDHADVSFAVVCFTGDDRGGLRDGKAEEQQLSARQNVVLELGYFLGLLGRDRVCSLYVRGVEIPSDYSGVLFVPLEDGTWKLRLARELRAAGLPVDMNDAV